MCGGLRETDEEVRVNPNDPIGGVFDMAPLPALLRRHPRTFFLVDESFIGLAGETVVPLVPRHPNLLVTRTLSKAHSLAGFRVGYGVFPEAVADDLNRHNDANPLARPSQAAALATLEHEDQVRQRLRKLRAWAEDLAARLRALGVRTHPTATYFLLADFGPRDAAVLARALETRGILVKPLLDPRLGSGYLRITTALPDDNSLTGPAGEEFRSGIHNARISGLDYRVQFGDLPSRSLPVGQRKAEESRTSFVADARTLTIRIFDESSIRSGENVSCQVGSFSVQPE